MTGEIKCPRCQDTKDSFTQAQKCMESHLWDDLRRSP